MATLEKSFNFAEVEFDNLLSLLFIVRDSEDEKGQQVISMSPRCESCALGAVCGCSFPQTPVTASRTWPPTYTLNCSIQIYDGSAAIA